MIDGNQLREEFGRYLAEHKATRWGMDAALMHVCKIAYDAGKADGPGAALHSREYEIEVPAEPGLHPLKFTGSPLQNWRDEQLLAHIQRGAAPEGWKLMPVESSLELASLFRGAEEAALLSGHDHIDAFHCGYRTMLAAAPTPDHFRDAAKMMAEPADPDPLHLSRILHELAGAASLCWEPRPTGVFDSQLAIQFVEQALAEIRSRMTSAPAEAPMPKPVAYGFGNTAITGHTNRLMMVRIDVPLDDQYAGAFWLPLVLADEAHTYGVACRAAGEAAGYARGLKEADKLLQALRDIADPIAAYERDLPPGYTLDGAACVRMADNPETYRRMAREAIAAMRGEVKP